MSKKIELRPLISGFDFALICAWLPDCYTVIISCSLDRAHSTALSREHDMITVQQSALSREHDMITVQQSALSREHDMITVQQSALS